MPKNYDKAVNWLFNRTPLFQNIGSCAYKEGLENTIALDRHFGSPHRLFQTVHIAGTNGKGSVSHTLAAALQASGMKVGLYTSPHLVNFRERIRIDGVPVSEEYVAKFINENSDFFESIRPSFFEVTTAMAFSWFAHEKVDIAVIETGLGGRLDCTNIITPKLCVITNIGFDHMQFLGNTLESIAAEKAGIIKHCVPVVIGEDCPETRPVFQAKADKEHAPIVFAQDNCKIISTEHTALDRVVYKTDGIERLESCLAGMCQEKNANTILHAIDRLRELGYGISDGNIRKAFADVCQMTGLMGRWQQLYSHPDVICDTGHNSHGIQYTARHLEHIMSGPDFGTMRIVIGMVGDKDIDQVLELMPEKATYYFTQASVKRAMNVNDFQQKAMSHGLKGAAFPSVETAFRAARKDAAPNDMIFVGGSTFVVADLLGMPEFSSD